MSGRQDTPGPAAQPTRQFVANLTRLMAEREMAPDQVAAAADIHRSHLNLILHGERVVQLDTLVKLAGALGVEPAELLTGVRWVSDGKGGGEFEL
jgi:transcriptional regulator with XRE-family HTH domain